MGLMGNERVATGSVSVHLIRHACILALTPLPAAALIVDGPAKTKRQSSSRGASIHKDCRSLPMPSQRRPRALTPCPDAFGSSNLPSDAAGAEFQASSNPITFPA